MTTLIPKFDLKNGGSTPTGAVNRPINQKLSEFISVLDFGADPTGVADNAAIFQSVFDLAFTNNFEVYIPAGTYKIASVLTLTTDTYGHGLVITGSGFKTTVLSFTGTGFMQSNQTQVNDYITISDMTLINASSSATIGMDIGTVRNGYFENINVQNFTVAWGLRKNVDAIGNYYNRFISCVGDCGASPVGSVAWQFGNNIVGHTINGGNANTLIACKSFGAKIGIQIIAGYGNSIVGHQITSCSDSGVVFTVGSNNYIQAYIEGSTSLGNAAIGATQNTLALYNDGSTSNAFVDTNGFNILTGNASADTQALPKYVITNNKIIDQIPVIGKVGTTINVFKINLPNDNCAVKVSATIAGKTNTINNWAGVQTWDLTKVGGGTPTATAKTTSGNYTITATAASNGDVTFSIVGDATQFTSVQLCLDIQGIASYGTTGYSTQITYTRLV